VGLRASGHGLFRTWLRSRFGVFAPPSIAHRATPQ